jgi:hypothetical protein
MKAKLVKTERKGRYLLLEETEHGWKPCLLGKLSKQNCDEIFGVIDVEEIADRHTFGQRNHEWKAYIAGFNKNAELNKDKVFTIEDMKRGCSLIFLALGDGGDITTDEVIESVLSTQQPNEIEVEIEMQCCGNYSPPCNINCEYGGKPKLDSEGCIILTKKI